MRTPFLLSGAFVAALLVGCNHHFSIKIDGNDVQVSTEKVVASGPSTTETRTVGEFHELRVGGAIKLEYTTGSDRSVTVRAAENIQKHVIAKVENGTLTVETQGSIETSDPIVVTIHNPTLNSASISGASDATFGGIKSEKFALELSGASKAVWEGSADDINVTLSGASSLKMLGFTAKSFSVDGSGNSTLTATGTATSVIAGQSGACEFDMSNLSSETAEVDSSGASSMTIYATKSVKGSASGASNIKVKGGAKIDADASGASQIEKL